VREHVTVERVQGGIVEVGGEHALAQVVEHDDLHGTAQPAEGLLVQLGPALGARLEGQKPDAFAAVAQREDNQVIVFTDWTGRSPQEVENQVTYRSP